MFCDVRSVRRPSATGFRGSSDRFTRIRMRKIEKEQKCTRQRETISSCVAPRAPVHSNYRGALQSALTLSVTTAPRASSKCNSTIGWRNVEADDGAHLDPYSKRKDFEIENSANYETRDRKYSSNFFPSREILFKYCCMMLFHWEEKQYYVYLYYRGSRSRADISFAINSWEFIIRIYNLYFWHEEAILHVEIYVTGDCYLCYLIILFLSTLLHHIILSHFAFPYTVHGLW